MTIEHKTTVSVKGFPKVEIDFSSLPDEVIKYLLERGVSAVSNSARAGKQGEEADSHQYHRIKEIAAGILPKSGGSGPRLSDEEKAFRQVMEQLAVQKLRMQTTDARKMSTADDRLEQFSKAFLKAKGEKQTKDRLAEATEKLEALVTEKAAELVKQWNAVSDLDL
jgi:hypothetical protein